MDLGELRKAVDGLLDEDALDVPWGHLLSEGHRVTEDEVLCTLQDGDYDLHDTVEGRYVATYAERGSPIAVIVMFELWEWPAARRVRVLTAFHARAPRGPSRER